MLQYKDGQISYSQRQLRHQGQQCLVICILDLVRKRHVVCGVGVVEGVRGISHQVRVVEPVEVNADQDG